MRLLAPLLLIAAVGDLVAAQSLPRIGMQLDVGLPGAAGATVLFRPMSWLRTDAGLAYDYIGYGVRGGVRIAPFTAAVTPTIGIEAGHYFTGDATELVETNDPAERAMLRNAAYNFVTAQLGLEFGSQRHFSFYVRGGISYVSMTADGDALGALVNQELGDTMVEARVSDGQFKALLPSASVGFNVYFK